MNPSRTVVSLTGVRAYTANFPDNGLTADYATAEQVAARTAPGAVVCCDPDCDLSGGYAHVGLCEPCGCGKEHALAECPSTPHP